MKKDPIIEKLIANENQKGWDKECDLLEDMAKFLTKKENEKLSYKQLINETAEAQNYIIKLESYIYYLLHLMKRKVKK